MSKTARQRYFRERRADFHERDLCIECGSPKGEPAERGKGATGVRCSVCAESHRSYYRKRSVAQMQPAPIPVPVKPLEKHDRVSKMMVLSERLTALERLRTA